MMIVWRIREKIIILHCTVLLGRQVRYDDDDVHNSSSTASFLEVLFFFSVFSWLTEVTDSE